MTTKSAVWLIFIIVLFLLLTILSPVLIFLVKSASLLLQDLILFFKQNSPNPSFLSDVVAFEAVVIALSIPISIDVVTRISDRYQSDVIGRLLMKEKVIGLLPILLLLNIVASITLRFFINKDNSSEYIIFEWLVFMFFIITVILLFIFYRKIIKYSTNEAYVLNQLFSNVGKATNDK